MFTVSFYIISKRINSTKQPTDSDSKKDIQVVLKNETSCYNPVFEIHGVDMKGYNYCKWGSYYYWIVDVVSYKNNGWIVSCKIDVLATWKNAILNTSGFVLYSEKGGNVLIQDSRIPLVGGYGEVSKTIDCSNVFCSPNGETMYILAYGGYKDVNSNIAGMGNYMLISSSYLNNLLKSFIGLEVDIVDELNRHFGMASNSISEIYALPYVGNFLLGASGGASALYLGYTKFDNVAGYIVNQPMLTAEFGIPIEWHYSDWRKKALTNLSINLPCYGAVELDVKDYYNVGTLRIAVFADIIGGNLTYEIYPQNFEGKKTVVTTNVKTNLPTLTYSTASKLFETAVGSVGSLVGWLTHGRDDLLNVPSMISEVLGGNKNFGLTASGAFNGVNLSPPEIILTQKYLTTSVEPSTVASTIGIPTYKQSLIGSFSGFVCTQGFSVNGSVPSVYASEINSFMNGGAYIE